MVVLTWASSGEALAIGPVRTVVMVAGASTPDRLSVVELHVPFGWYGPPVHVHEVLDQLWYVAAGQIDVLIDGQRTKARSGDVAVAPRGVAQGLSTLDSGPVTLLAVDPGRALDGCFRDPERVRGTGVVDPTPLGAVSRRHDSRPAA